MSTSQRLGLWKGARTLVEVGALAAAFVSAFVYRFAFPIPADRVDKLLVLIGPGGAARGRSRCGSSGPTATRGATPPSTTSPTSSWPCPASALVLMVLRFLPATPERRPPVARRDHGELGHRRRPPPPASACCAGCSPSTARRAAASADGMPRRRVLLVGAGRAGVMVAKEIAQRPELGIAPLGFVDDDPAKAGRRVAGLEVLGTTHDLALLAQSTGRDRGHPHHGLGRTRRHPPHRRRLRVGRPGHQDHPGPVRDRRRAGQPQPHPSRVRRGPAGARPGRPRPHLAARPARRQDRDDHRRRRLHRVRAGPPGRPLRPPHDRAGRALRAGPVAHPPRAVRAAPAPRPAALHRRRLRRGTHAAAVRSSTPRRWSSTPPPTSTCR